MQQVGVLRARSLARQRRWLLRQSLVCWCDARDKSLRAAEKMHRANRRWCRTCMLRAIGAWRAQWHGTRALERRAAAAYVLATVDCSFTRWRRYIEVRVPCSLVQVASFPVFARAYFKCLVLKHGC